MKFWIERGGHSLISQGEALPLVLDSVKIVFISISYLTDMNKDINIKI
jgi:hypothetical protein